jgi:hypothetical protein
LLVDEDGSWALVCRASTRSKTTVEVRGRQGAAVSTHNMDQDMQQDQANEWTKAKDEEAVANVVDNERQPERREDPTLEEKGESRIEAGAQTK